MPGMAMGELKTSGRERAGGTNPLNRLRTNHSSVSTRRKVPSMFASPTDNPAHRAGCVA